MNSWIIALLFVKRTIGTKKGFILTILLPTVVISACISLFGGSSSNSKVAIAYMDLDQSEYSMYMIRELEAHPSFTLIEVQSEELVRTKVIDQDVDSAFIIPAGYGQQFISGKPLSITQLRLALNAATFSLEQSLHDISTTLANTKAVVEVSTGTMNEQQILTLLDQLEKQQVSGATIDWEERKANSLYSEYNLWLYTNVLNDYRESEPYDDC